MKLPIIRGTTVTKDYVMEFKGLNRNEYISEGEFAGMINMTTDDYPVMSTRQTREEINFELLNMSDVTGILSRDGYYYICKNEYLYRYGRAGEKDAQYYMGLNAERKKMLNMGAYIVVFPDKKMFNTQTEEVIEMEKKVVTATSGIVGQYTQGVTDNDGEIYPGITIGHVIVDEGTIVSSGDTAPTPMGDLNYWWNTAAVPTELNVYSKQQETWNLVSGREYVSIVERRSLSQNLNISGFEVGDSVSYGANGENKGTIVKILDGSVRGFVIKPNGEIPNIKSGEVEIKKIEIYKDTPDMDYVVELNNRLYGCNSEKHEIYVSALGNASAWYKYEGIASDSYTATIGTDGDFTGAAVYNGYVYFFKENYIHVVSGTKPANFTITTLREKGIEGGSGGSAVVIGGYLFFKSTEGIVSFNGSTSTVISDKLKIDDYKKAVAGIYKRKYYVSLENQNGNRELYIYDTNTGFWVMEDDPGTEEMINDGTDLMCVGKENVLKISRGIGRENIKWFLETGDIDGGTLTGKFVHKIMIRASIEKNMRIEIMYDSDGVWRNAYFTGEAGVKKVIPIPIVIQRCNHFRLKISGEGGTKIFAISKFIERGNE